MLTLTLQLGALLAPDQWLFIYSQKMDFAGWCLCFMQWENMLRSLTCACICSVKLKSLTCDITWVFGFFPVDGSVVPYNCGKLALASTYHYNGCAFSLHPPVFVTVSSHTQKNTQTHTQTRPAGLYLHFVVSACLLAGSTLVDMSGSEATTSLWITSCN